MTKQEISFTIPAFILMALLLLGLGVFLGFGIWGAEPSPQYSEDCLDNLANEICIEEGYEKYWGEGTIFGDFACTSKSNRSSRLISLDYLEGEKESCIE